jgi:hypothetical protein
MMIKPWGAEDEHVAVIMDSMLKFINTLGTRDKAARVIEYCCGNGFGLMMETGR